MMEVKKILARAGVGALVLGTGAWFLAPAIGYTIGVGILGAGLSGAAATSAGLAATGGVTGIVTAGATAGAVAGGIIGTIAKRLLGVY